jgi:DNA topoisomerase-1
MSIAQALYEGVQLGEQGQVGLITYMRTDSFRLSKEAISEVRDFIGTAFGSEYVPPRPNHFRSRKGAQEAHEAIRPTSVRLDPDTVSPHLNKDQRSLYTLIWKRFVSCQMNPAVLDQTQAEIVAGKATFKATGSVVAFDGFTLLYQESQNGVASQNESEGELPPLRNGLVLDLINLEPAQHFTQPPPRFSEATLIKALEENGIGRPSTYATILANISGREYVTLEKKRFKPTELGFLVTDLLVKSFPNILDTAFTAKMENNLDKIERGEMKWTKVLEQFYGPFHKDLEKAQAEMKGEVLTDLLCPQCNRPMAIKSGKNGLFLACTGYPECRNTTNFTRNEKGKIVVEAVPEPGEVQATCEVCGREMVVKKGKFGSFLACSGYPECKNTKALESRDEGVLVEQATGIQCKMCGAKMVVRKSRTGQRFLACVNYPKCTHTESIRTNVPCPNSGCDGMLVEKTSKKGRKFYGCNQYPTCRFAMWDEPFDGVCPECGTRVLGVKRGKDLSPVLACRKKGCSFTKPLPSV